MTMKAFKTYWLAAAGMGLLVAAMLNASALAAREKDVCPITRGDADDHGKVAFIIPSPGVQTSALEDGSVSFAIPLQNAGSRAVANVSVNRIQVPSATRLAPNPLPVVLGEMIPGAVKVVDARFVMTEMEGDPKFPIIIGGTYNVGTASCKFETHTFVVPQAVSNAPIVATNLSVSKHTPFDVSFPPTPTPPPDTDRNAGEIDGIRQPLGLFRNLFPAPPSASLVDRALAFAPGDQPPPGAGGNSVVFIRNTPGNGGGLPPDPSVAGADSTGFAMFSVNTFVAVSNDFGKTFTNVGLTGITDPAIPGRTDFFPQDDGGLCCDQVLIFIPGRNIYVWLLQYWSPSIVLNGVTTTGQNRLRIAWATPQAASADFLHAWTWVDLTAATLGLTTPTDWMDYPDLAFSNNFLYVGVDHGFVNSKNQQKVFTGRHIFARLSLDDMVDTSKSSVGGQFMEPARSGVWQNHIVHSSPDSMFWTALPDTSTLVVFSWPDSSNSAASHDIRVSMWCNTDYSAVAPDNISWNAAPANALGAARTDPFILCPPQGCGDTPTRFLYFAWSAGRNDLACRLGGLFGGGGLLPDRPFPYVRVEKVDLDRFALVSELDIWNPDFAFATPGLVSRPGSGRDEVAISLAVGGGGNFGDNAVGFLGDFVVYVTTDSDATQAVFNRDSKGNIINDPSGNPTFVVRYGDYFHVRNSIGPPTQFGQGVGYSTLGYAVKAVTSGQNCATGGCNVIPHYVQFGRDADLFPSPPPPPPK